MKIYIADIELMNEMKYRAYFDTHDQAKLWVNANNSNGMLKSFQIDHRDERVSDPHKPVRVEAWTPWGTKCI